ncbi:endonuclease domain-containing protein [Demequina sp. SO4-13]|uniref:endonuclease domain-containing protein n=1 Tax=Demequina sp. SO4-13 TaxID=3401027 RepID=UPI003AF87988
MGILDLIAHMEALPISFSLAQLTQSASRGGVDAAVQRGSIVRVMPDRYAAALHADSWAVRSHAAAMWGPAGCALTGTGVLFDARLLPAPPDRVQLLVPHWRHRPSPSWVLVTSSTYRPPLLATRSDGATVVDPALALIHAYGRAPEREQAELLYGLTRSGAVDPDAVRAHLERLPRVRGRASLLRRCELAVNGVESYLEERGAEQVLVGAGFESIVRQHRVRVREGRFRLDAYDPQTRTAFEFDGAEAHDGSASRLRDIRRDAALTAAGIVTVRFGYADVTERPEWCREIALATLLRRSS